MGGRNTEENTETKAILQEILEQLKALNSKIDCLLKPIHNTKIGTIMAPIDVMTLLTLPLAHKKTVMALYQLKKATADDISQITGRKRPVESSLANELVRLGHIQKKKEGLKTFFFIESKTGDT